jgi:hypothetical protein
VSLIVDSASAVRRLGPEEFSRWAATRTVFLSSEMRDLGQLRVVVADALRDAGVSVVMFEDLGGRDEVPSAPTSTASLARTSTSGSSATATG